MADTERGVETKRPTRRRSTPTSAPAIDLAIDEDGGADDAGETSPEATELGVLHDASVYEREITLSDENDAHTLVVRLVGRGKRVLELGCAAGSTTKVLRQRGCTVVGIEIDPDAAAKAAAFAERVVVADLDVLVVSTELTGDSFDVIVAADVLEHLRNPQRCLRDCVSLLRPEGEVILSIPNVAHADLRLALLQGQFQYQPWGLLDETHLRFFTRDSLRAFIQSCGLVPLHWDRVQRDVGATEVEWRAVDDAVVAWVSDQPDADTYQFIVRAAPAGEDSHLYEVTHRLMSAEAEIARLEGVAGELSALEAVLVARTTEHERLRDELSAENERIRSAFAAEQERMHRELETEAERLRNDLGAANDAVRDRDIELEVRAAALADAETALAALEQLAGRGGSEVTRAHDERARLRQELQGLTDRLVRLSRERDEYKTGFDELSDVHDQLVAVRRSESFRVGQALLSPFATVRRVVRAWRRAGA